MTDEQNRPHLSNATRQAIKAHVEIGLVKMRSAFDLLRKCGTQLGYDIRYFRKDEIHVVDGVDLDQRMDDLATLITDLQNAHASLVRARELHPDERVLHPVDKPVDKLVDKSKKSEL